jgi:hypothetical protein
LASSASWRLQIRAHAFEHTPERAKPETFSALHPLRLCGERFRARVLPNTHCEHTNCEHTHCEHTNSEHTHERTKLEILLLGVLESWRLTF